jgi:hypothetical protein
LFMPEGAIVLSLLIQCCSRSILYNSSFMGIRPPDDFLGTISTGVIVSAVKPPHASLLKCSATGVFFLV